MNAERLLKHYEQIADAPDATTRLRRFVLDLAVRGKLVPQDANDESASELLKGIVREKARLARAGEIAHSKSSKPVSLGELAFSIPHNWQPVNIEHALNELQTGPFGSSLHQSDYWVGGTPVINPASIQNEQIVPVDKMAVDASTLQRLASFKLRSGDIVMARRGEMGRCAIVTDREAGWLCGTGSLILRPSKLIYARFLALLIGSPFGREYLGASAVGSTMQNLNQSILLKLPFGLPPFAEQRRIVGKVDDLMGLCDQLEAARGAREATRDRLTASSLARLNSPNPETFQADARFALDALPLLTTRSDQIKQLRQTILNLAVRGKLVPQQVKDEPISTLLEGRKIVADAEGAFAIPSTWSWVTVGAIAEARLGKMLDKAKNKGTPRRYLRNTNVRWFDFNLADLLEMRFEDLELEEFALRSGDVLICEGGEPGRAAVWDERESDIYFQKAIHRVRFLDAVSSRYFVMALRASADDGRLSEYFTGTGIKHFTGRGLDSYVFPLPPVPEQHRIVAKVDALMTLCDRLEASLAATAATRRRLLDALLAEALAPAEDREMEAAE